MTHDEAYVATVTVAFHRKFGEHLTFASEGMETVFERASKEPLRKRHVVFLDGVTVGFWSRHQPQMSPLVLGLLRKRASDAVMAMAKQQKSVGIRRALYRAAQAVGTIGVGDK